MNTHTIRIQPGRWNLAFLILLAAHFEMTVQKYDLVGSLDGAELHLFGTTGNMLKFEQAIELLD